MKNPLTDQRVLAFLVGWAKSNCRPMGYENLTAHFYRVFDDDYATIEEIHHLHRHGFRKDFPSKNCAAHS